MGIYHLGHFVTLGQDVIWAFWLWAFCHTWAFCHLGHFIIESNIEHISRNCKDWQSWNNKPHEKNVPAFQIFFDLAQAAGYLKKWQKLCRLFYNVLKNTNVEMRKWATQLLYYCCRRERERDSHNFFFEQKHFLSIVSVSFAFISWRVQRKEISFFVKCLRLSSNELFLLGT